MKKLALFAIIPIVVIISFSRGNENAPQQTLEVQEHIGEVISSATIASAATPTALGVSISLPVQGVTVISEPPSIPPSTPPPSSSATGGFIKTAGDKEVRPRLSLEQIQSFLPERGAFIFPAPYSTQAARITNSSDCANTDCVHYAGYSYWRNMNNHVGKPEILIFVGLKHDYGGPTLYSYNKSNADVTKVGPLFDSSSAYSYHSAEGWYWSAIDPYKIYVWRADSKLSRYDVNTKQFETVLDIGTRLDLFGANKYIWQVHSSDDDKTHIGTVRDGQTYAMQGCFVYKEDTKNFSYYPTTGGLDECNLDGSGRWLVMLENDNNRIVDLTTGSQATILDKEGALGHLDMGYGYAVGADNYNPMANASIFIPFPLLATLRPVGDVVHINSDWNTGEANHISHQNRKAGVPAESQYACGSNADSQPRENEIVCFKLDGSLKTLVVAPVMTSLSAAGGGSSYNKYPKGNLDITGEYFFWTSNMNGPRLDAFIVKIPYSKL